MDVMYLPATHKNAGKRRAVVMNKISANATRVTALSTAGHATVQLALLAAMPFSRFHPFWFSEVYLYMDSTVSRFNWQDGIVPTHAL